MKRILVFIILLLLPSPSFADEGKAFNILYTGDTQGYIGPRFK